MGTKTISDKLFSCNHKSNPVYGIGKKKKNAEDVPNSSFYALTNCIFFKVPTTIVGLKWIYFWLPIN